MNFGFDPHEDKTEVFVAEIKELAARIHELCVERGIPHTLLFQLHQSVENEVVTASWVDVPQLASGQLHKVAGIISGDKDGIELQKWWFIKALNIVG